MDQIHSKPTLDPPYWQGTLWGQRIRLWVEQEFDAFKRSAITGPRPQSPSLLIQLICISWRDHQEDCLSILPPHQIPMCPQGGRIDHHVPVAKQFPATRNSQEAYVWKKRRVARFLKWNRIPHLRTTERTKPAWQSQRRGRPHRNVEVLSTHQPAIGTGRVGVVHQ